MILKCLSLIALILFPTAAAQASPPIIDLQKGAAWTTETRAYWAEGDKYSINVCPTPEWLASRPVGYVLITFERSENVGHGGFCKKPGQCSATPTGGGNGGEWCVDYKVYKSCFLRKDLYKEVKKLFASPAGKKLTPIQREYACNPLNWPGA